VVIILSNPFLFYRAPREEMLAIQSFKTEELSGGYTHDSSPDYARGPRYWRRTLNVSYGQPWMMLVFAGLLLAGCAFGHQRKLNMLIAAWSLPLAIYLLWFVSPKPDHYLLPLLIPVFSAGFDLVQPLLEVWAKARNWQRGLALLAIVLIAVLFLSQFSFQITRNLSQLSVYYSA
jgi:TRAP-type C4-dicarboxylate transport system permease small subunit